MRDLMRIFSTILVIVFTSQSWATSKCLNSFFNTKQKIAVVDQLPNSERVYLYHLTLVEFIRTYNDIIHLRASYEVFKPIDTVLFEQKNTKEQLIYILKQWQAQGNSEAVRIRSEIIDSIQSVKGNFTLYHLKTLTNDLANLLKTLTGESQAYKEFLKHVEAVNSAFKKRPL